MQSFKLAMKSETEVKPLSIKLTTFLLAYRNNPHSTTGEAPSQLFWGRRLRTRLDLLKPDLRLKISNRQIDQTVTKGGAVTREFSIGQTVIARNYTGSKKWVPGIIRTQLGPLYCKYLIIHSPQGFSGIIYNTGHYVRALLFTKSVWVL